MAEDILQDSKYMTIQLSPQFQIDDNIPQINYYFNRETVHITLVYQDKTYKDFFDFSDFQDGYLITRDDQGNDTIQHDLPFNPIVSASRVDGELTVTLLYPIKERATEEERFPEPFSTKDVDVVNTPECIMKPQVDDIDELEVTEGVILKELPNDSEDTVLDSESEPEPDTPQEDEGEQDNG